MIDHQLAGSFFILVKQTFIKLFTEIKIDAAIFQAHGNRCDDFFEHVDQRRHYRAGQRIVAGIGNQPVKLDTQGMVEISGFQALLENGNTFADSGEIFFGPAFGGKRHERGFQQ